MQDLRDLKAHTNVLMTRQMACQAEKWHLKLSTDISELENRELLEQIKEFEEREFSGAKKKDFMPVKLAPVNDTGLTQLLNMKIDELQSENEMLLKRLSKFDKDFASNYQRTKSLTSDLQRMQDELRAKSTRPGASQNEVDEVTRKMNELQAQIDQEKQKGQISSEAAERQMASTQHELLRIKEMLEMAEKELEKKVSQTTPFKNLKQMLQRKNDQMKDLRKRLMKYEAVTDD